MNFNKFLSLKEYNTFGIDAKCVYSFFLYDEKQLIEFFNSENSKNKPYFILGGGSNVLFTNDYDGTIIFIKNKGIEIINEDDNFVFIKAQAGENWDEFVEYCVSENYGGIENLSLIPGTVGATPVQNIGAYGVEVKDVIFELEVFNIKTLKKEIFKSSDCNFGYRNSIFKKELKDKYIILSVTYKLSKKHKLKLNYGAIKKEFKNIPAPNIKDVRNVIIKIRESKLPAPENLPNAGSFFKNPSISKTKFDLLKIDFPKLVSYPLEAGSVKLAAGQLIDFCKFKGIRENGVGVHDLQALVVVNYNNATGKDILKFSQKIQQSVFKKFGITIEREVTIVSS